VRPDGDTTPVVSYVIAAHNSATVIENTIEAAAKRLTGVPAEIIVVENGSTDRTTEILAQASADWPAHATPLIVTSSARGLGNAVRAGLACSRGRVVVITADDLPFGFDDLDAAEARGLGRDVIVIGSKAHPSSDVERSWKRTLLSTGYGVLRRLILGMKTADPQGTYILDGAWGRAVGQQTEETGFLITTEIAYAAELAGIRPVEVPIRLRESAHRTRIKVSDIYQMGAGLFQLRRRRRSLRGAASAAGTTFRGTEPAR